MLEKPITKYQEDFRVLIQHKKYRSFLSDEEGILQFYSEANALGFIKDRKLQLEEFDLVTRPIIENEFSVEP